ncbi:MAG: BatA domain-containing protein [Verrucomicrobia bacterium]|nr:BatA domain-containing protein [Verrucomicrobiota bacterium]
MGFLNPWMLIGLAAAGIPVMVHLVFRRKAKVLPFPSIVFLRELDKEVVRRRRVEQWLVMLLRIAVVVLFTLFVAKPYFSSRLFASGASKAVVVIFDDSYSMRVVEGRPLHDKAKDRVLELLSTLDRNDRAGFLSASGIPEHSLNNGALTTDHAALVRHVEALEPGAGAARLNDAFARALDTLHRSKEQNRAIVVVSDLQRRSWMELSLPEGDPGVTLLVVNVAGQASPVNAAVTGLEIVATPERELSRTFTFLTQMKNHSSEEFGGRFTLAPLRGQAIDEGTLSIRAGRTVEKRLKLRAEHQGWYTGRVVIEDDDLALDNARYYALEVGGGLRVGIFDQAAATGAARVRDYDDVFFLGKVLDPLGTHYPFDVTTFASITRDELAKLDVVILPTLPTLDTTAHAALKGWLTRGGGGVCFARPDADMHLATTLFDGEVRPGEIERGLYKIGADQLGLERLLFDVDVYARAPLTIADGSSTVVLATFQDDAPYIVERAAGEGCIVLFGSGYDLDSTNIALRHASLPLMYTLLFRITPQQPARAYVVGDMLPIAPDWRGLIDPRGQAIELSGDVQLAMPGIYAVRADGEGEAARIKYFAVNVDTAEGDLARYTQARQIEGFVPFRKSALIGPDGDLARTLRTLERGAPLWNWFLYAAAVIFLVEVFMANKAGQRV